MTEKMSDAEYEALVEELVSKQKRRNVLQNEIADLQETIRGIEYANRGYPTEPGMYWHPGENWPAYLDEIGRWTDGWGNLLEEEYDLENVKRVVFDV